MNSTARTVLLLLLPFFAYAQDPSAKGVNLYSLEREFQVGQEAAARMLRALPVVHDPQIDQYLENLTAELVRHADSRFAYSFTVFEDRKPWGPQWVSMEMPMDAFHGAPTEAIAFAGGPIFVPMSLIADAPDEAALVFQLAHAIAHVALRHSTKLATRQEIQLLATVPLTQQVGRTSPIKGVALASGAYIATEAAMFAFARQFELAADLLATGIMAEAGYDPSDAISYLQRQPAVVPPSKIHSAHPAIEKRLETIKGKLEKLPPADYDAGTGAFEEIKALTATVR